MYYSLEEMFFELFLFISKIYFSKNYETFQTTCSDYHNACYLNGNGDCMKCQISENN